MLKDFSEKEKVAYLGAIASIATAETAATIDELYFLEELTELAGVNEVQKHAILGSANGGSEQVLKEHLHIVKGSNLRYSLVADLIAFAESDTNYDRDEKGQIIKIAFYLNITDGQFKLLEEFVKRTRRFSLKQLKQKDLAERLGLAERFRRNGIDANTIIDGLIGMMAPVIMGRLLSWNSRSTSTGLFSHLAGSSVFSGGMGSMISIINGSRGIGHSGGFVSRIVST